jgi:hypothetical protein
MMKHINIASRHVPLVLIAAGYAVLYTALLVMSTGCALAHAEQASGHPHHHSEERSSSQNALCAWACQATADAAVAIEPSSAVTEKLVGPADFVAHQLFLSADFSATQSRAPPPVRLG